MAYFIIMAWCFRYQHSHVHLVLHFAMFTGSEFNYSFYHNNFDKLSLSHSLSVIIKL